MTLDLIANGHSQHPESFVHTVISLSRYTLKLCVWNIFGTLLLFYYCPSTKRFVASWRILTSELIDRRASQRTWPIKSSVMIEESRIPCHEFLLTRDGASRRSEMGRATRLARRVQSWDFLSACKGLREYSKDGRKWARIDEDG